MNLYSIDPHTLDPAVSGEATSHQYILQIFSGLVYLDDKLQPAPDIAEKWQVGNEGRTYTFSLRRNVRFHDGKQVKAADFKYSWERALDPATDSSTAPTYLSDIVGAKDILSGKSKELSGVKVIDDFTLEVTIDAPKSYFLWKLTYPTSFVVDRANVALGKEWWRKPNGTGAFKLNRWVENQQVVLDRNESYFGEMAKVASVIFQLYSGRPIDLYETGKIDVAGVSLDYIDKVMDKSGPFYKELQVVPELSFSYIGFNATEPPFDDVNVRKAFSHAVDKDRIVALVFRNMMKRADGILPPGIPGYNPNLAGLGYDVNKARELIKASKYGDVSKLPPITMTTSGWGGSASSTIQAMVQQWRENLGVEVKVRQLEPPVFFYKLKQEKDAMFDIGWVADYPHPQDFLDILFHTGTENNYGGYSNPEVDAIVDKANVEPDMAEGLAMYRQAEQKLVQDAALLPLSFGQNYVLVKSYVKGYNLNALGYVMLNRVSVAR
ncbi:MAG: peptide ABC transporter substrate-binding protein [Dehalococcoidia bacterium]|nr:peptide ABC transporter substrate-binding protein [Dehalococcoidia bacterium]